MLLWKPPADNTHLNISKLLSKLSRVGGWLVFSMRNLVERHMTVSSLSS